MKNSIKLALVLTVISVLYTIIMEALMPLDFLFSWKNIFISYALTIGTLIFFGRKWLRNNTGSLDYGEALKWLFFSGFIAMTLSIVLETVLYQNDNEKKVAFNDFIIRTQDATIKTTLKMTGVSDEQIELELEELHESVEVGEQNKQGYPFSFSKLPTNILDTAISAFIFALICAIFVKTKNTKLME